jgi:hypothetical protein
MALTKHNLEHLYKYTTASVAKIIISTQSFRWSSPLKFNDPFDHQTGVAFPYSGAELAQALHARCEVAIFGEMPFVPIRQTNFTVVISRLREIRGRLPRVEVMDQMRKTCEIVAANHPKHCADFNNKITAFLTHSRVLCVSEASKNVVMWSHYADAHRGVVFELLRLEALDHRLLAARRVDYTSQPVTYLGLQEQIDNLMGLADHDIAPRVRDVAYVKHVDWKYEQEWRVHFPMMDQPAGDGFSDLAEPKELFESVILGCNVDRNTAADIKALLREHLPDTKIFQARKAKFEVRLEVEQVS